MKQSSKSTEESPSSGEVNRARLEEEFNVVARMQALTALQAEDFYRGWLKAGQGDDQAAFDALEPQRLEIVKLMESQAAKLRQLGKELGYCGGQPGSDL